VTPLLLALALLWVPRPGYVPHVVIVGASGWYNVRTANARVGRFWVGGSVLRFNAPSRYVTVTVTREP
jgi:hypothetical protein